MKRTTITCIAGAFAVTLLAGCSAAQTSGASPDDLAELQAKARAAAVELAGNTPTVEAEEDPAGTYTSSCDYLLDFDNGHEFVGDAFITNPGSSALQAVVTATWRQAGHDAIVKKKTLDVPGGSEDLEVHLRSDASRSEIDRIQALDTDKQCSVKVTMI